MRAPLVPALVALLAGPLLLESLAHACEPPLEPPLLGLARAPGTEGPLKVPKNAGLLFDVALGTLDDATARQRISIEVRSGGTVLPGTIRTVGDASGAAHYFHWQWLPEGATELPIGTLDVESTANGRRREDTVIVEDRVVEPAAPTLQIETTRELYGDESSPQVSCSAEERGPGSCVSGTMTWKVPTRAKAFAKMNVVIPTIAEADKPYFESTFRLYGRTKGKPGPAIVVTGKAALAMLEGVFDEYCADVVVEPLAGGAKVAGETTCVPSTFDTGALSVEVEKAFVSHSLQTCSNPVYPPGTSADNPTGRDGGGCSVGSRGPGSELGAAVLVGLCALVVRRRRIMTRLSVPSLR